MIRAGVFIGVDRTGDLHQLHDAAAGAARMHAWARAQGMDPSLARLITDADGARVEAEQIYRAIEQIVDGAGVDQLIVYFAGHGVNLNRGEQWLLSDAPRRTSAAVNVSGSVDLARYCGIRHVVVISDTCRVAPEGIQAQNVRGVDVFPNEIVTGRAMAVDQFFACCLGRTAAELRDPADAAAGFSALYTGAVLDALLGRAPEVLERGADAADPARYVRPRPLRSYLESEVPRRVRALGLERRVNQEPDAIITSDGAWLSRLEGAAGKGRVLRGGGFTPGAGPATLQAISRRLVHAAAQGDHTALERQMRIGRQAEVRGAGPLVRSVEDLYASPDPDDASMRCGITVRGARIDGFYASAARGKMLSAQRVRIDDVDGPAASVLLRFDDGTGTVVPVMNDFVAVLTFQEGELVDVAYEPAGDTPRGSALRDELARFRALRAVAASAAQHGRFRLEGEDAAQVARRMQRAKAVDPSFAVYAAYAYHDLGDVERIQGMSGYLKRDFEATWFDVALLGRMLAGRHVGLRDAVFPFVPLLSQGWALLGAHRVHLDPALQGIEETLHPSLWSLYGPAGVGQLADALYSRAVR